MFPGGGAQWFGGLKDAIQVPKYPLTKPVDPLEKPVPKPFVRGYNAITDYDSVVTVFQATLPQGLKFEPAQSIAAHAWCIPYLLLCPTTCFVLDDGTGEVAGFILGPAKTEALVKRWEELYLRTLTFRGMPKLDESQKWNMDWVGDPVGCLTRCLWEPRKVMMDGVLGALVETYSAHLRIGILESHQGRGFARLLIESFAEKAKEAGAKGVHLIFSEPTKDLAETLGTAGFRRFEGVLDGGRSWKLGKLEDGRVCFVRDL